MSTINSADNSSRQDDVIRRNREDARQSESEMVKKHQKELKRLAEQHHADLERLEKSHQRQITELKKQTQDSISKRDHRYQKEIDGLRDLHRKQLQETATNAAKNVELTRKTTGNEVEMSKARNDQRVQDLNDSYRESLTKAEQNHEEQLNRVREEQQKSVQDYRERMNTKHQKEVEILTENSQKEAQDKDLRDRNYRRTTEARYREQEMRHMLGQQKASEDLVDAVKHERLSQTENEKVLRQGFKEGLQTMRERYDEAVGREREAAETASRGTKADVYERVTGQMRSLERENSEIKQQNVRNELNMKREKDREVQNTKTAYQANVEEALKARDQAVRDNNAINSRDIHAIREKDSALMMKQSQQFLEKMDGQEARHKTDIDVMEGAFNARLDHGKNVTDQRVKQILNQTEADKARLAEYHDTSLQALSRGYRDETTELRLALEKDKLQTVERMKDLVRKQEIQHNDKLQALSAKYEKEIMRLSDELNKTKRNHDEEMKRVVSQMQRNHQNELDAQNLQYQEKMRKTQDQHSEEMRVSTQRNQERFDQLITTMKKA